jgi:dTDP-D-glucose 4,6-dehydratase
MANGSHDSNHRKRYTSIVTTETYGDDRDQKEEENTIGIQPRSPQFTKVPDFRATALEDPHQ